MDSTFPGKEKSVRTLKLLVTSWGLLVPALLAAAPANDNFFNAGVVAGISNVVAGSNAGATRESGEPFHNGLNTSRSVWWTWDAPVTGTVEISTTNSSFDTLLAVYTGDVVSNLNVVISNDDDPDSATGSSRVLFRAMEGETFRIAVDGFNGATGNISLTIKPGGRPLVPWVATNIYGGVFRPSDFTNVVVALDVWATNCIPCINESEEVKNLQRLLQPFGFTLLGLTEYPSDSAGIRSFVEATGINYPVALYSAQLESALGTLPGLPTKFIVDREGKLVAKIVLDHDADVYGQILSPLLRNSSRLRLTVERSGSDVRLSWPATEFGCTIQSAENPVNGMWTNLSAPVTVLENRYTTTVATSASGRFYRLKKPAPVFPPH